MKAIDRDSEKLRSPIRVFCGVDPRQMVGFSVFASSVIRQSSMPVQIMPVSHSMLGMGDHGDSSTQFNYTRFLVPYLCGFKGHAIWCDGSDMLLLGDIAELWAQRDFQYPVKVVQHPEYVPAESKFLDQPNRAYPRKNWSSVMLYWADHMQCKRLIPSYVAQASGAELHQFGWLEKDKWIGSLPEEWNVLAGEATHKPDNPKLIHYTLGIPAFSGYSGSEYGEEWWREYRTMQEPISHQPVMDEPQPPVKPRGGWPKGRPRKVVTA